MPSISSTLHSLSDFKKPLNSCLRLRNTINCTSGGRPAKSYKCPSSENGSFEGFENSFAFLGRSFSSFLFLFNSGLLVLFEFELAGDNMKVAELEGKFKDEELPG